jgi:hypothetical protein
MEPRRKTLRQSQTASLEKDDRALDLGLVRDVEALGTLPFRWEQAALEEASERVYRMERALMPRQRQALLEILKRRGDSEASEGDG